MARALSNETRQHIVETAAEAFYRRGFQAVGVEELAAVIGISKMTLYRYFPSKDEVVVAVLDFFDAEAVTLHTSLMSGHRSARERLLAVFDWIADTAGNTNCAGCAFQHSAAEYPDPLHPIHEVARRHKATVRSIYLEESRTLPARDPDQLADQLVLLTDGAWIARRIWGPTNPSRAVVAAAQTLIDAQLDRKPAKSRPARSVVNATRA